ncbi:hypothetical protein AB0N62_41170 [Streptomyces sp. NPDC093982]|uniref:hypothetical protein n=1 Tax=Streptomyces sp. NPDC093982 TaxID=3155077 RepID=UPI0034229CAF
MIRLRWPLPIGSEISSATLTRQAGRWQMSFLVYDQSFRPVTARHAGRVRRHRPGREAAAVTSDGEFPTVTPSSPARPHGTGACRSGCHGRPKGSANRRNTIYAQGLITDRRTDFCTRTAAQLVPKNAPVVLQGLKENHPRDRHNWAQQTPPETNLPYNLLLNAPYNLPYRLPFNLPPRCALETKTCTSGGRSRGSRRAELLLYETLNGTQDISEEPQANDRRQDAGRGNEEHGSDLSGVPAPDPLAPPSGLALQLDSRERRLNGEKIGEVDGIEDDDAVLRYQDLSLILRCAPPFRAGVKRIFGPEA